MNRRTAALLTGLVLLLLVAPSPGHGQGLPAFSPINPLAASRTPLGFEPFRPPRPGRWTAALALDYGSAIESVDETVARYDLDAELLRLRVRVARDLGPNTFVELDGGIGGSYPGFLDGFLDWYHGLLGITLDERDRRPPNAFLYRLELPSGKVLDRPARALYLGDLRVAAGFRLNGSLQTVASISLPTSTAPAGYGRGVVAAGVETTLRLPLTGPLVYEGSLGLGYTPAHGDLSEYQRRAFVSGSSGLRWRFWGRQSLYGNLFVHSSYYHGTGVRSLDRRELDFDFGWILATRGGREWRVGLTEDLEPGGPGIDLIFRLGVTR
ncbi:MAG TPA: DUF3187 family protein [Gemmatimonadales bacterium]|nr:DUF3187 family protein [Gemmatimonadales bacterium]